MASLFKVKALYEFEAKEEDDLGFDGGQIIDVTEEIDANWLEGKYTDASGESKSGIFPREFVEKYEPPVPSRPTRPARPKQEPVPEPVPEPVEATPASEPIEDAHDVPAVPAVTKPPLPPVDTTPALPPREEVRSPPANVKSPTLPTEPPAAPKPTPAEPAAPAAKKPPPPIAAKSNAFRDRIAAFNAPAAAPIAPMVPGGPRSGANTFIKKPFVAPPPMANSYVPPPVKAEPVHKPYIREEDPEIKRRREEDQAAAEAAGFSVDASGEQEDDAEDAPKPQTLKERIALLQQQQLEQAQRRADGGQKKEKKAAPRQVSESSEQGELPEPDAEADESEDTTPHPRQSLEAPAERPRVPSAQRKPTEPLSPGPVAPDSELVSDGNDADQSAAGETTEDDTGTIGPEDSDETSAPRPLQRTPTVSKRDSAANEENDTTEDAEDDEDSMDEETRKRMEIRERMAKMSGGMGMPGMFGAMPLPGAAPIKKRKEKKPSDEAAPTSPPPQQRVPMIPVPGLHRVQSPESAAPQHDERFAPAHGDDELESVPPPRRSTGEDRGPPPPIPTGKMKRRKSIFSMRISRRGNKTPWQPSGHHVRDAFSSEGVLDEPTEQAAGKSRPPQERGAPPPVPGSQPSRASTIESRPVPPPPPPHANPLSPGTGSESDDEASVRNLDSTAATPGAETPGLPTRNMSVRSPPPVPGSETAKSPEGRRASYFSVESQTAASDRRASRAPPPVPGSPITSPRAPPPPPPQAVSHTTDLQAGDHERESEYEGDYDTDIASSAKHKDALKAGTHVREPSLDDNTDLQSPPPPPHGTAPRSVPPPPPAHATRPSMDAPRAPPPVPPAAPRDPVPGDDDYDPFRYDSTRGPPPPPVHSAIPVAAPPVPPPRQPEPESSADDADELYSVTPPKRSFEDSSRLAPAPPAAQPPPPIRAPPRESVDQHRSNVAMRRSMDQPRPSMDNGHIAQDIDMAESTTWWSAPQALPPSLQNRQGVDILSESEETTASKRGGRKEVTREIYVLYIDYSQTIITVRFDASNPTDAQIEQQHRPPPAKLRQEQLEGYWQRFGRNISESVNALGHAKKDTSVGNGSPAALPAELIKSIPKALQPVGNRAYGALVYANLANASTQQFDEIRPGDIVTLRNTRFEGTHGAVKHKYKQEYGSMHVAIVEEWDGTRRAIRGWEQGREKQKVRSEKFRLGDLRSGEVKVWRVVGRDWVEWETSQ